ncbi:MAG: hypothetical protein HQL74_03030 [Magnetococcales bacterium]|nr:hypothetical protein [Magnetococcales bacterium]
MLDGKDIVQAGDPPNETQGLHVRLQWARQVLGLGTSVTRAEFKGRVRYLLQIWHPDHATCPDLVREEVTQKIILARDIINDYLENYRFSFLEKDIDDHLPPREWLLKRFGDAS